MRSYNQLYKTALTLFLAVAAYHLPEAGSNGSAAQRSDDEYPELAQGSTACKYGGTYGAGGID